MKKTYTKFNLLSLLAIILIVASLPLFLSYNSNVVSFKDKGLETAIRKTIGKEEGAIYLNEVDTLEILDAKGMNIEYLDGIENLVNLQELYLEDNFIKDVSPLQNNIRLRVLDLRNNEITSLEEINFDSIIYLHIRDLSLRHNVVRDEDGNATRLKDITLLGQLLSLRDLDLRDNHVEDLTPISNLRRLTKLDLRENRFTNIDALATLTRLEELNLRDNTVNSLEPLRYLHHLKYLNIHSVEGIETLEPLEDLNNLETLIMRNVKTDSNEFLKNKTKLQRLNAIDTGLTEFNNKIIIENILNKGGLTDDVRPYRLVNTLEKPIANKESGFYKEAFEVTVDTKGDTYYTLDGSEPTLKSNKYEEPIQIDEKDIYSSTVLKLKTFNNILSSETVSKTYFVNQDIDNTYTEEIKTLINNKEYINNGIIEYEPKNNIIHIKDSSNLLVFDINTIGTETPNTKSEGKLNVEVVLGTEKSKIEAYGTIKVQGASTSRWPKKNWNLRLYKDQERKKPLYLQIDNSIPSNKWILKADWIDPSMYRQPLSFYLWDEIVKSRENNFIEVETSSISNKGAKGSPYVYQGLVNINSEFYGLTNILLGHNEDNFNIDNNNNKHLYFEFDARGGEPLFPGWQRFTERNIGKLVNFYNVENDSLSKKQKDAIKTFSEFIQSDIETFKLNFNKFFNQQNMVDMILFYEFLYDWDGIYQDIEMVTYDLEKFYFLPWDKDTTFGIWYDGSGIVDNFDTKILFSKKEYVDNENKMPWVKTYYILEDRIKERYIELRNLEVFSFSTIEKLIYKIDSIFSEELRVKDIERWEGRPSVQELTKEQLISWTTEKLSTLDKHFGYEE